MLTKLRIANFQAHGRVSFDLNPGVTTFVGRSDSGKSAIVRAIYWAAFNRPAGDAYRKHGTDRTRVILETEAGTVERRLDKTGGEYRLEDLKFRAFGRAVPAEIERALNLSPLSFQFQFDPPLWLTDSPGTVAGKLNEIADLSILDRARDYVARVARNAAAEQRAADSRIADLTEQQKRAFHPRPAAKLFAELKIRRDRLTETRLAADRLEGQIARYQSARERLRTARIAPEAAADLERLKTRYADGEATAAQQRRLATLIFRLETIREKNEARTAELAALAAELKTIPKPEPCPTCGRL